MGVCNSSKEENHTKNERMILNSEINHISNETMIPNSEIKEIDINLIKVISSIGKIKTDDSVGSGFFIRLRSSQEELYCLMTNEHVITKRMVLLMKPF